jgi:hypothetical protein
VNKPKKESITMNEYEKATAAHDAAFYAYDEKRKLYRTGKIGDDEFLEAMDLYKKETEKFDAAFNKAANQ